MSGGSSTPRVVAVSGYFDPLHVGHLEMFQEAKALGDRLVVILNNTEQALAKKGYEFMPVPERAKIISNLDMVDEVFVSIDEGPSVVDSLAAVHPDVFCNGGDRNPGNVPEQAVCDRLGIEMAWGIGRSGKIQSSSELVRRAREKSMPAWGYWEVLERGEGYKIKRLEVRPGAALSYQRHGQRSEHWVVVRGTATVITETDRLLQRCELAENESIYIPAGTWHQLSNGTDGDLYVIEVSTGGYIEEDDIERRSNLPFQP